MARKDNPGEDEAVSRPRAAGSRGDAGGLSGGASRAGDSLESRLQDLEADRESPFLRAPTRVNRGPFTRKGARRFTWVSLATVGIAVLALIVVGVGEYARNSWRFRLDSSDQIQLFGNHNVDRNQVLDIFGSDISRNIFLIPLAERRHQLEQIPWVGAATVMRLWPNRLRVDIQERVPVAYVQLDTEIKLVDPNGVILDNPSQSRFSFPVILGFSNVDAANRAARMRTYTTLLHDLDAAGSNYSRDLNEVDLSDPEDIKITVTDPEGEVLIHLGSSGFRERYQIFVAHVREWRQQFQKLDSVDLRYERQVIVNPDNRK